MTSSGEELQPAKWFSHFFAKLSGFEPYPWQTVLFRELLESRNPEELCLPTGLGKTAVMHVWLLALAWEIVHPPRKQAVPRRLVWVVDRRVVVDQATEEAELLAKGIKEAPEIEAALERLSVAGKEDGVLAVSVLRGERADNRAWSLDPSRPAIIVGTVDMIGSRMLFSGYGDGSWYRPQHAGLLGQDVLLVNDEAHLTPAFANLINTMATFQRSQGLKPFLRMRLSATPRGNGQRWPGSLTADFIGNSHSRRIYTAEKRLRFRSVEKREPISEEILQIAVQPEQAGRRILIFVREPEKAAALARKIRKRTGSGRVRLITGIMRGWERDRLVGDPIFRLFASRESPTEPCWLVATSAAEVGANISSDLLITDLDTADHLIQRFGRLNRFGETRGQAYLIYQEPDGEKEPRLQATLEYLTSLLALDSERDISLCSLFENPPPPKACSEEPATAQLSPHLLDRWSQTSLCPHPARPPVEAWLHGKQDDLPETEIAWRDDVSWLASPDVTSSDRREVLRRHRVLTHERLREATSRVWKKLQLLPAATRVLLLQADGAIGAVAIHALVADPARLRYSLILLPSGCGSIEDGMFQPHAPAQPTPDYDVADRLASPRRARFIAQADEKGWRIRPLGVPSEDQKPVWLGSLEEESVAVFARALGLDLSWQVCIANPEEDEMPPVALLYFREPRPKKRPQTEVLLDDHLQAVADMARSLAEKLQFAPDLAETFEWAGRLHDLGKAAPIWQNAMGGDPARPLAKTARPGSPTQLAGFRHELASLIGGKIILDIPLALRDLALHLVAAHHGWARPHFPDRALDRRNLRASQTEALECARRFARLQEVYGYRGLAYLEAMFKAADAMISAEGYDQPDYA